MPLVEVLRTLDDRRRNAVERLVHDVQAATGRRPLSDQLWLDLISGRGEGFVAMLAWTGDTLAGYGQLSQGHASWTLEIVSGAEEPAAVAPLLDAALRALAESGGGEIHWWMFDPPPGLESVAREAGMEDRRALFQMRTALPLPDEVATAGCDVSTRPFRVDEDEQVWLDVNNAAFAGHPEQGGWDLATLRRREVQPWFDPEGFLMHERDGRLAAFCWTKAHVDETPVLGEIYVVAVHPDFHGLGLGKALTVAGLQHIARRGIATGMLYVDRDNVAAVWLYRRLGFTTHRTDRAFVATVPSAPPQLTPGDNA